MKGKILEFFITVLLAGVMFFVGTDKRMEGTPVEGYQVYLNGNKIGLIQSKNELYNLIDTEQKEIKEAYEVNQVYPPNGLDIEKIYTYNKDMVSAESIYNDIKDIEPFTIEGYVATIKYTEKQIQNDGDVIEPGPPVSVYLKEKDIMKEALYKVASAFIGKENLKDYENKTQVEITDVGEMINSVYFEETITVKKDLVSTEEYIFQDADTLSRYLLFGTLEKQKSYITKEGEDLEKIADANSLNIEELLIANPQYPSGSVLLSAGEEINVGLIKPLVRVVYRTTVIKDESVPFKSKTVKDSSKYTSYREVTQEGKNGLSRLTQEIKYINGEIQSLDISNAEELIAPIDEIVTRGSKREQAHWVPYENTGNETWSWPTLTPFYITSRYKWRWGRQHQGIDIAISNGHGSPIYAVKSGVVTKVNYDKNKNEGLSVTINHRDGWYTIYMHLSRINVKEGQEISKEQKIGGMGCTGSCTGTHLHLGVYKGEPYRGGQVVDPCSKEVYGC